MIDVKEAVKIAIEYFESLNKYNAPKINIFNVLLEEVFIKNYQDITDCWYVTLGYNEEIIGSDEVSEGFTKIFKPTLSDKRKYKTIVIDPDGNVKAMKMREVEYA